MESVLALPNKSHTFHNYRTHHQAAASITKKLKQKPQEIIWPVSLVFTTKHCFHKRKQNDIFPTASLKQKHWRHKSAAGAFFKKLVHLIHLKTASQNRHGRHQIHYRTLNMGSLLNFLTVSLLKHTGQLKESDLNFVSACKLLLGSNRFLPTS